MSRFSKFRCKEVINMKTGIRLGYVDDGEIDEESGKLLYITVLGPGRFLGIFAREPDYIIHWDSIHKIGEDIILVSYDNPPRIAGERPSSFSEFLARIFK